MTDLERIIADMRTDGAADTLYSPERMTYYADRLAALSGAGPVAIVVNYGREDAPLHGLAWLDGQRPETLALDTYLYPHAPAKAREVTKADAVRAIEARNDYLRRSPGEAVPAMRAALATFAEGAP